MEYKHINRFSKFFLKLPYFFYSERTSVLYGKRLIQITTVGRTSNTQRATLLEVIGMCNTSPVVIAAFGENSDWVKNLRKNPKTIVVWSNKKYESDVFWLDKKDSENILKSYKKDYPNLVKFYERLMKMGWDDFSNLPVCSFPEKSTSNSSL